MSKKEQSPSYQWYPKDYLSSTVVALMSLEQEGAYRRLLDYQWLNGSIPADLPSLARLCRVSEKDMRQIWEGVRACFEAAGDEGRLVNSRLEVERQKQAANREERSQAGRKGNAKRWQNDRKEGRKPVANGSLSDRSAIANLSQTDRLAFAIAIPSAEESVANAHSLSAREQADLADQKACGEAFERFRKAHPRKTHDIQAAQEWNQKWRAGLIPPIEELEAKLAEQCASDEWRKEGGRFIPRPHNYVRDMRWRDEVKPPGSEAAEPDKRLQTGADPSIMERARKLQQEAY